MKKAVRRARLVRVDQDKIGKEIPIYRIETNEITRQQVDLLTGKNPVARVTL